MRRAALPLLLLLPASALAQTRPLLTEEATTAPAGTLVLEAGVETIRAEPNFLTLRPRDRWDVPVVRLVYSPADPVEIDLEWTARILVRDDPDFGNASDFGDVVLRTKVRFVEPGPGRPAFGARFVVALPETRAVQGLGPNALRMSAQFLLSQALGRVTLHANAGVAIEDKPLTPQAQSDFLAYGLAAVVGVSDRLGLLAEVNGLGVGKGYPGADRHAEARAGLRWRAGRVGWDAAVRRGLAPADGRWGATAGLSWTLKAGR